MAITIDRNTNVIFVPQADLTFIGGTLYELDTDVGFRLVLKAIEAGEEGIVFTDTHSHFTEVTIAGATQARTILILSPFTVEFEDGQYAVRLAGSNNNIFDEGIIVRNQVSIIPTNSFGLISIATPVVSLANESFISATYDRPTTTISMGVWLRRGNAISLTPTSCQVDFYNANGTLLFTQSNSSPDSRGFFSLTRVQALSSSTTYYADVTVTDSSGSVVTRQGIPTVG